MNPFSPEPLLQRMLQIDAELIEPSASKEAKHFMEFGECGLAYDVLVFEIEDKRYIPSTEGLELIKQSAIAMGLVFPQLSTS